MRDNVAQAVTLMIGRPGFEEVLEILKGAVANLSVAEQRRFTDSLNERIRLLEQQRENCQILAEEGRAARKPITDRRAAEICRIYKRVRRSHAPGRTGNGETLAEVARQFGPAAPDRESDITTAAIRKILKRCGVPCR
jgi:hypothetical protein